MLPPNLIASEKDRNSSTDNSSKETAGTPVDSVKQYEDTCLDYVLLSIYNIRNYIKIPFFLHSTVKFMKKYHKLLFIVNLVVLNLAGWLMYMFVDTPLCSVDTTLHWKYGVSIVSLVTICTHALLSCLSTLLHSTRVTGLWSVSSKKRHRMIPIISIQFTYYFVCIAVGSFAFNNWYHGISQENIWTYMVVPIILSCLIIFIAGNSLLLPKIFPPVLSVISCTCICTGKLLTSYLLIVHGPDGGDAFSGNIVIGLWTLSSLLMLFTTSTLILVILYKVRRFYRNYHEGLPINYCPELKKLSMIARTGKVESTHELLPTADDVSLDSTDSDNDEDDHISDDNDEDIVVANNSNKVTRSSPVLTNDTKPHNIHSNDILYHENVDFWTDPFSYRHTVALLNWVAGTILGIISMNVLFNDFKPCLDNTDERSALLFGVIIFTLISQNGILTFLNSIIMATESTVYKLETEHKSRSNLISALLPSNLAFDVLSKKTCLESFLFRASSIYINDSSSSNINSNYNSNHNILK